MMSFSKVLIANRGEIAVRLIRACRVLDLQTVAVYSAADANALHVQLADEAVPIGPAEARASYLDGARLIEAARATGAGAVHPGYGFLAENADFAQACIDAGLVFVGPSPRVIAAMGAKIEAKRIAERAGVMCVPGYHGEDRSRERLRQEAERIGTPLLIKASAGGGGRGMRRIDDLAALDAALGLAADEARAAFGDPALLLERYVEQPRHIEVQILADRHGSVRHLYERDCSVQRNYQKVIEEAPAPNLAPALRQRILDSAVKLASAIGYDSAGTVEFVVDGARDEAYFLEMNTRLQVEHPVTEMVTGIDLAVWQLRVAAGEAIDFAQQDVRCQGWAMELRLAAEDPAAGYQPQTGTISRYVEPDIEGLRMDSGVRCGSVVSPYYDSMLAKLIAHAPQRAGAIRKLRRGLGQLQIGGLRLNSAFLDQVLQLSEFVAGEHATDLLVRSWPEGWQPAPLQDLARAQAVLARHLDLGRVGGTDPWTALGGWRLGESCGRLAQSTYYLLEEDGRRSEWLLRGRGGDYTILFEGLPVLELSQGRLDETGLSYLSQGTHHRIALATQGAEIRLLAEPSQACVQVLLAEDLLLAGEDRGASQADAIVAPTPGQVVEVLVAVGDPVTVGQPVVVLEAMKMLQQLCAGVSGVVTRLPVQAGDAVNSGDPLAEFEPD